MLPLHFRDANNKNEIVRRVQEALDISIHIVEGEEEALLIHEAIRHLLDEHKLSTRGCRRRQHRSELDTGSQKIVSRSFDLGAMRTLGHYDVASTWSNHASLDYQSEARLP